MACLAVLIATCARADDVWNSSATGEWQLAPGLRLVRRAWTQDRQRGTLCALFADPAKHRLELFTAESDGGRRRPVEWISELDLVAVINAAMFQPNGRSTALMVDGPDVNNGYDHPNYAGFLAFAPKSEGRAPLLLIGRDCAQFDLPRLRADYGTIVQNYRLLDCEGKPIVWRDRRRYPATAIGVGASGELVFVHSGGALDMSSFGRLLSEELKLSAAVFTEGGPQAALSIRLNGRELNLGGIGDGPVRSLPLVIGLRRP